MVTPNEFRNISKGKLRGKIKITAPKATVLKANKGKKSKNKSVPQQGPMPRLASNPVYNI